MTIDVTSVPPDAAPMRSGVAVKIQLYGRMGLWAPNGDSLLPIGRKTRALVAILAVAFPRPVIRSRLAELLWSQRLEEQARASLRQEIHRLLEALQPAGQDVVRVARDHLTLWPAAVRIDVDEVMRATVADSSALALMDGELLAELNGTDPALDAWLAVERERLRDRARTVLEALLERNDRPEEMIPVARRLLSIDRAHEGAWRATMRAHAVRSERGLAIQAFDRCRSAVLDLTGAAPSPQTQRLAEDIRAGALQPSAVTSPVRDPPSLRRESVRLGVLPLRMIGTSEHEAHLSAGLANEVTAALARFRSLVLVSSSSLGQRGMDDEGAPKRVPGVDFLLDGSVQRDGSRLRITMRLLDLRDGNKVVWARRFDRLADDLLTLQDEIAAEVAAQIDLEVMLVESRRATLVPATESTAYELVARALPLIERRDREDFREAGTLLSRATEADPEYAAGHAWRAYWAMSGIGQGWAREDSAEEAALLADAGRHANRAITLDPEDARGFTIAGHVRAFLDRRPRESLDLHHRALSLNPNLAMAWALSAISYTYLGLWDEAARRLARYKRLSPVSPNAFFLDSGTALLALGRRDYAGAVQHSRRASDLNPYFVSGLKYYLSALGHLGARDEAETVKARLLAIRPELTVASAISRSPFEQAAEVAHYADGLRATGLREG